MASMLAIYMKLMFLCITGYVAEAQLSGDLRLMDGTSEVNGRLEVYRSGRWGTVCNSGFDSSDGTVACRQLGIGYNSYTASYSSSRYYDYGRSTSWLENARCSGSETRLDACDGRWSRHSCYNTVVLTCRDPDPPVVSGCPHDIEETIELGTSGTTVNWTEPTAVDMTTVTTVRSHEPGTFFVVGITHVAYIFTDTSDNIAACSLSVIVQTVDTTPPTITNCTHGIRATTELGTNETDVLWNEPNATDISGTPHKISSHVPSSAFSLGVTEVTYLFVDASNNTANCTFSVIVETVDTTPPEVYQCPSDLSSVGGRHVWWREPTAFDLSYNITLWKSHSPGLFVTEDSQVVYNFTDASGCSNYCRFLISIIYDIKTPAISECPNDTYAELEIGSLATPIYWRQPSATDDNERVTLLHASHTPGQSFPVGTTSVTYVFVDDSYNEANCMFLVIVNEVDTTPPTIESCSTDINVNIEPGKRAISIYWDPPLPSDVSGIVSLVSQTHHPGDRFAPGRTPVHYVFEDGSNNKAFCSFVVNLQEGYSGNKSYALYMDREPPIVINCPLDINISAELGTVSVPVFWLTPTAIDQLGSEIVITATHTPGDHFVTGSTTIASYLFEDEAFNRAICNFSVTVVEVDTKPPDINYCPDDIDGSIEIGSVTKRVFWTDPIASDTSGVVSIISQSHFSGNDFIAGTTGVKYVYQDAAGNDAVCQFYVSLTSVDTTAPQILNCPSDITVTIELGETESVVKWKDPETIGTSENITRTSTHIPGQQFLVGITTVVYNFQDLALNQATCSFSVHVKTVDTKPPVITFCPEDIDDNIEHGSMTKTISWSEPVVSDTSGSVSMVSQSHFSGNVFVAGTTGVKYVFEDAAGNEAVCQFYVSLTSVDTTAPAILNCPSDITVTIELGETESVVKWTEPETIGASENTTRTSTHKPGQQFPVGITTVVYNFQDSVLNQGSCSFSVNVETEDTKAPTILHCPSDIFTSVEVGSAEPTVSWIEPETEDESESVSLMVQTHASGSVFMTGSTTVFYLFEDDFNNVAVCSFVVTLESVDTNPPDVFGCPADIHTTADIGAQQATILWTEPWAYDKSGSVVLLHQTHTSGEDFELGLTPVSYTFADHSNNVAICAFVIVVNEPDISPPSIDNCPDDIVSHTELEAFGSIVSWIEPEAIDDSGKAVLLLQTHDPGTFFALGTTKVTYIFKDGANNMEKCSFSVTVAVETSSKIYNCPSSIVASVTQGENATSVTWKEPFVIDFSAKTKSISSTHRPNNLFRVGKTRVMYKFEDDSSKIQFCNFTVTVIESVEQLDDDNLDIDIDTPPDSEFLQKKDDHDGVAIAGLVIAIFIVIVGCSIFLLICFLRRKNTSTDIEESRLSMIMPDPMDKNTNL